MIVLGIILFFAGANELYWSFSATRWSKTIGKIIEWKAPPSFQEFGRRDSRITYTFEVDGYNYVSSNIKPGIEARFVFRFPFLSQDLFTDSRFATGAMVEVMYDVRHPRRCALEEGGFVFPTLATISGVALIVWGFYQ